MTIKVTQRQVKLAKVNNTLDELKETLIIKGVRERYTQNQENAILRKKLANLDVNNEFDKYNAYVEEVKKEVHNLINSVK